MKKRYHMVTRAARESAAVIEQFCQSNGRILLPIVKLIESASQVVETVIHEIGVQTLEMILMLSAEQVAGPRTPGKASGDIRHHGAQPGQIQRADRKVRVKRPRLRHKSAGEVKIPAYEALRQDRGLSQQMRGAPLRGVSTREYPEVLPQMAATVGVSRSAIGRQAMPQSQAGKRHEGTAPGAASSNPEPDACRLEGEDRRRRRETAGAGCPYQKFYGIDLIEVSEVSRQSFWHHEKLIWFALLRG